MTSLRQIIFRRVMEREDEVIRLEEKTFAFEFPQHYFSTLLKVCRLIDSMNEKKVFLKAKRIQRFNLLCRIFMYDKTEINVHHRQRENDKLYINIEKIIEKI